MRRFGLTRRRLIGVALAAPLLPRTPALAQANAVDWAVAPIGWPGRVPGEGFRIGHGFACENAWFAPGWWHTGEDWYAIDGETAGADIYAMAAGEVVYAGFNYPGRVVILRHEDDLHSMYGHLEPETAVGQGRQVAAGDRLGVVLPQADVRGAGQAPSHLHVEVRTFLTRDEVNGNAPQHGVNCGFQCPPGPGYWPMSALEHPADLGWRNPTHVRLSRAGGESGGIVAVPNAITSPVPVHASADAASEPVSELAIAPGQSFPVLETSAGDPASTGTGAEATQAWLRLDLGNGASGWVQAAVPSARESGSDGRPSSLDVAWLLAPAEMLDGTPG